MKRLSQRISRAVGQIECPGCHNRVTPDGEICPECQFPLSRFKIRLQWFRIFFAGALILAASITGFVLGIVADLADWLAVTFAVSAAVGLAATGVGLMGIIFGGRHVEGQARKSSNWVAPK